MRSRLHPEAGLGQKGVEMDREILEGFEHVGLYEGKLQVGWYVGFIQRELAGNGA